MSLESQATIGRRLARRFVLGGVFLVVAASVLLCAALLLSIQASGQPLTRRPTRHFEPLSSPSRDIRPLQAKMAAAFLIKPSQVQAAVKDDGTAGRLAKQLKLQGIVQIGDELVAYVQVEKAGVKTVRKGQTLLDFLVEDIEAGKIKLSWQGVIVFLEH